MLPELKPALMGMLGGYVLCVLLPLPWASGRVLRAWARLGAALSRGLHRVTAVAQADLAHVGHGMRHRAAPEPVILHPDTIAALAAAIAAPLTPVRPAAPPVLAPAPGPSASPAAGG